MKSVPNLFFFKPMNPQPEEHHWSNMQSYKLHLKIMQTSKGPYLRVSHTIAENPMEDGVQWINPPYRPGEKCYVREAWMEDGITRLYPHIKRAFYKADGEEYFDPSTGLPCRWRSPVTMPQWAARRFVTILSCEPMRVEDVTREDCARLDREHLIDTSLAYNEYPLNYQQTAFRDQWRKRHPGKEWCWRVVSEEEK